MNETKIDYHIANWISDLEKLNTEKTTLKTIQGINPVLINVFKAIMRGQYTPEQLKTDLEAYMTREAFRGWQWTKENERYFESRNYKFTQLMTKEHEHGFI
jgi:hypothetical protein